MFRLETSGKLMELQHKKGTLRVNYSDRLVRLLREVRQLTGLGYPVPAKIQHCATTAHKFYKHAIILKQVHHPIQNTKTAFFYNLYIVGGAFLQYDRSANASVPTSSDAGRCIGV